MATLDPQAVLQGRLGPRRSSVGFVIGVAVLSFLTLISVLVVGLPEGGPVLFLVGLLLAVLPAPITVAGILLLDRLEPEPTRNLVIAFLWGAGVATLVAGVINTANSAVATVILGRGLGMFLTVAVGAPLVEESLKGFVLLGLLWFRRRELDGPTDGIVYAGMVGLGFAIVENVGYYARFGAEGELIPVFLLRGVISPLAHPLFTSMIGIGIAYAALSRSGAARFFLPVLGWCGAVFLHAFWNGSSFISAIFQLPLITQLPLGLVIAWLFTFLVLVGVLLLVMHDRRRIVALIGRHLSQYVPTGLVASQDIAMLSAISSRRAARRWARRAGGSVASRAMGDYQLAATELALLHTRAERGVETPPQFYPRRDALLHLMGVARQAFLSRLSGGTQLPWAQAGPPGFGPPPPPTGPPGTPRSSGPPGPQPGPPRPPGWPPGPG
ncbi:MAG: PrsW family intramembrane metalloprotease [Streptosporangiales bacterium]|nr:PrsW family intramembrane metalloprotease [Streptosporangiales bacterium]